MRQSRTLGSVGGGAQQCPRLPGHFERQGQFEAELGENRFTRIRSRLVQGDPYAVFSMGNELSVLLGSFGEDDALEDQSSSCAAVHR